MLQKDIMEDICTYLIEVRGQATEEDLNLNSPLSLKIEKPGEDYTLLSVITDQSGLVGLIRHLHGLGFMILSINSRLDQPVQPNQAS